MTPEEGRKLPQKLPSILDDLPVYLKDPANYEKVQKALIETLASRHSHSDLLTWYSCKQCENKIFDHREMMMRLGFKSPTQYYAWKRIHEKIRKLMPLVNWNGQ